MSWCWQQEFRDRPTASQLAAACETLRQNTASHSIPEEVPSARSLRSGRQSSSRPVIPDEGPPQGVPRGERPRAETWPSAPTTAGDSRNAAGTSTSVRPLADMRNTRSRAAIQEVDGRPRGTPRSEPPPLRPSYSEPTVPTASNDRRATGPHVAGRAPPSVTASRSLQESPRSLRAAPAAERAPRVADAMPPTSSPTSLRKATTKHPTQDHPDPYAPAALPERAYQATRTVSTPERVEAKVAGRPVESTRMSSSNHATQDQRRTKPSAVPTDTTHRPSAQYTVQEQNTARRPSRPEPSRGPPGARPNTSAEAPATEPASRSRCARHPFFVPYVLS